MVVLPYTDMNQPWVYICPPLYFLLKQDKSDLFWLAILYMYILNKIKGKVGFFSKHCEKVQQRFKFFFTILTVKSVILFVLCVLNYSVMLTLWLQGLQPNSLLCPWGFPGKNARAGCYLLLQGIFLSPRLNPCLLHCRQSLCRCA